MSGKTRVHALYTIHSHTHTCKYVWKNLCAVRYSFFPFWNDESKAMHTMSSQKPLTSSSRDTSSSRNEHLKSVRLFYFIFIFFIRQCDNCQRSTLFFHASFQFSRLSSHMYAILILLLFFLTKGTGSLSSHLLFHAI